MKKPSLQKEEVFKHKTSRIIPYSKGRFRSKLVYVKDDPAHGTFRSDKNDEEESHIQIINKEDQNSEKLKFEKDCEKFTSRNRKVIRR
mmetsp:Transcript_29950/g.26512  ORF Transcript_29950/g.26512 Transcript_29950/m.26512 type:complete len:88 (+) Transcript_29950:2-265(+)